MAQMMDRIEYLSKDIGPRPAGTEEEQQAALYIAEQFQEETDFAAELEEFACSTTLGTARAALAAVAVLATILAIIFPVVTIPAFILAAAAAAVYALEAFDIPVISRFLARGVSQNVVAKYQPSPVSDASGPRSRKIILVAHYDTDRVTPPLVSRVESMGLPIGLICVVGMIATAFFLLIRIFLAPGGGMGLLVLNALSILAVIVCLLPIAKAILMRGASYNEGANNNATGTAALIEVARRISSGSMSDAELALEAAEGVRIHGEEAAREAGLIPEGAQILYESEQLTPPDELGDHDEEDRLLSAKAAIAALTGQPVERRVYGSVADKLVNSRAEESAEFLEQDALAAPASDGSGSLRDYATQAETIEAVGFPTASAASGQGEAAEGFENAPSWFVAAQQNARKPEGNNPSSSQVQRSKYTEAFDRAARERVEREEAERAACEAEEARRAAQAAREAERRAAEEEARKAQAALERERADEEMRKAQQMLAESSPDEATQQAEAEDAAVGRYGHSESLPEIETRIPETTSPSRSGLLRKIRTTVPSLSGVIRPVNANEQAATRPGVSTSSGASRPAAGGSAGSGQPDAGSASSLQSSTIAMSPIDYNMEISSPGAEEGAAAPELDMNEVMIPRSRSGNLLERLRRDKSETLSDTPQEWLDVDDDFEARSVGRARGSWESFRDDDLFDDEEIESFGNGDKDGRRGRHWQGGAYSRAQLGRVNMRSGVEEEVAEGSELVQDSNPDVSYAEDDVIVEQIEQIYHFRNPQFNTEVWFVAVGADGVGHDGARAFIEQHRSELRGSMVIEIESLGVGALSVATEEGRVRTVTASSRVKRFTRTASAATGIMPDEVSLVGFDSIASTVQKAGFQVMHLFGAEDGRPALKGSPDDVVENIDPLVLDENVNFVYELLKQ